MNLTTEQTITLYWKSIDRKRENFQSRYENKAVNSLKQQLEPVLQSDDLSTEAIPSEPIQDYLIDLYTNIAVEFAKDTYQDLTGKSLISTVSTKNLDDLVSVWFDYFRSWVLSEGAEKVVQITNTTKTVIKRIVNKARNEGLSIPDTRKLLQNEWEGLSKKRATVIARTEIVSASNYGSLKAAESTGLDMDKIWISTRDSRTRDTHRNVDGQRVGIDQPFQVGGEQLQAPGTGRIASNVINCRCAIGYVRPE